VKSWVQLSGEERVRTIDAATEKEKIIKELRTSVDMRTEMKRVWGGGGGGNFLKELFISGTNSCASKARYIRGKKPRLV